VKAVLQYEFFNNSTAVDFSTLHCFWEVPVFLSTYGCNSIDALYVLRLVPRLVQREFSTDSDLVLLLHSNSINIFPESYPVAASIFYLSFTNVNEKALPTHM
jgi:hypothetical protein